MKNNIRHKLLLVAISVLLCSTSGCWGSIYIRNATPPPALCPIESLFIDETLIPEPLVGLGRSEPPARYGVEFEEVRFINPQEANGGDICQTIYRGWDESEASRGYREFVDTYFYAGRSFHCQDAETVWEIPSEIIFESTIADEWRVGCTMGCTTDVQSCQYIGRYGVYFVWYYAQMSDVVTYAEFENILEDIDTRMAQCLE